MPFGPSSPLGFGVTSYAAAMERAKRELSELEKREEELVQEQEEIRERIPQCKAVIEALAPLCIEEEVDNSPGLSEICSTALARLGTTAVTFPDLKSFLESAGVTLEYKNTLAVLHTTVQRLKKAGKARIFKKDGKTYCQGIQPVSQLPPRPGSGIMPSPGTPFKQRYGAENSFASTLSKQLMEAPNFIKNPNKK